MNREQILEQLQEALDAGHVENLPAHLRQALDADPQLASMWAELCAMEEVMSQAINPDEQLPAGLHARIVVAVIDESKNGRPTRRHTPRMLWFAAAAAVVLMVSAAGLHMRQQRQRAEQLALAQQAIDGIGMPKFKLPKKLAAPTVVVIEAGQEIAGSAESVMDSTRNLLRWASTQSHPASEDPVE